MFHSQLHRTVLNAILFTLAIILFSIWTVVPMMFHKSHPGLLIIEYIGMLGLVGTFAILLTVW